MASGDRKTACGRKSLQKSDFGDMGTMSPDLSCICPILGQDTVYQLDTVRVLVDGFSISYCEYDEKIDDGMVSAVIS